MGLFSGIFAATIPFLFPITLVFSLSVLAFLLNDPTLTTNHEAEDMPEKAATDTFKIVKDTIDDFVLVDEDKIAEGIKLNYVEEEQNINGKILRSTY